MKRITQIGLVLAAVAVWSLFGLRMWDALSGPIPPPAPTHGTSDPALTHPDTTAPPFRYQANFRDPFHFPSARATEPNPGREPAPSRPGISYRGVVAGAAIIRLPSGQTEIARRGEMIGRLRIKRAGEDSLVLTRGPWRFAYGQDASPTPSPSTSQYVDP